MSHTLKADKHTVNVLLEHSKMLTQQQMMHLEYPRTLKLVWALGYYSATVI